VHARAVGVHCSMQAGAGDADVHRDAPFEADAGFLDGEPRLLRLSSSRFIDEEAVGDQPNGSGGQGTSFHAGCANVGGRDADEIAAKHQNQAANGRGRDPTAVGRWVCILVRHASDSETERRESSDWKPTTRLPCCQNATRPVAENKLPVSGIKRTTAPTRTGAVLWILPNNTSGPVPSMVLHKKGGLTPYEMDERRFGPPRVRGLSPFL